MAIIQRSIWTKSDIVPVPFNLKPLLKFTTQNWGYGSNSSLRNNIELNEATSNFVFNLQNKTTGEYVSDFKVRFVGSQDFASNTNPPTYINDSRVTYLVTDNIFTVQFFAPSDGTGISVASQVIWFADAINSLANGLTKKGTFGGTDDYTLTLNDVTVSIPTSSGTSEVPIFDWETINNNIGSVPNFTAGITNSSPAQGDTTISDVSFNVDNRDPKSGPPFMGGSYTKSTDTLEPVDSNWSTTLPDNMVNADGTITNLDNLYELYTSYDDTTDHSELTWYGNPYLAGVVYSDNLRAELSRFGIKNVKTSQTQLVNRSTVVTQVFTRNDDTEISSTFTIPRQLETLPSKIEFTNEPVDLVVNPAEQVNINFDNLDPKIDISAPTVKIESSGQETTNVDLTTTKQDVNLTIPQVNVEFAALGITGQPGVGFLQIFTRSINAPATPTGGTFNFTTNVLTPPTDWSQSISDGSDEDVYATQSVVREGTSLLWSTPYKVTNSTNTYVISGSTGSINTTLATSPTTDYGSHTGFKLFVFVNDGTDFPLTGGRFTNNNIIFTYANRVGNTLRDVTPLLDAIFFTGGTNVRLLNSDFLKLNLNDGTTIEIPFSQLASQDELNIETKFREDNDETLQDNIDIEKQRITDEISDRVQDVLDAESKLTNEITVREGADTTLQTNINNEATTRDTNDKTLQDNIDTEKGRITDEITARGIADTTLQDNIDAEETRAKTAEDLNGANIILEAGFRLDADTLANTKFSKSFQFAEFVGRVLTLRDHNGLATNITIPETIVNLDNFFKNVKLNTSAIVQKAGTTTDVGTGSTEHFLSLDTITNFTSTGGNFTSVSAPTRLFSYTSTLDGDIDGVAGKYLRGITPTANISEIENFTRIYEDGNNLTFTQNDDTEIKVDISRLDQSYGLSEEIKDRKSEDSDLGDRIDPAFIAADFDNLTRILTLTPSDGSGDKEIEIPFTAASENTFVTDVSLLNNTLTLTRNNGTFSTVNLSSLDDKLAITEEAATRKTEDDKLSAAIVGESENREMSDDSLDVKISQQGTEIKALITAEETARETKDEELDDRIDLEATTRSNADVQINSKLAEAFDDASFTPSTRHLELLRVVRTTADGLNKTSRVVKIPIDEESIKTVIYNADTNELEFTTEDTKHNFDVKLGPVDNSIKSGTFDSSTHTLILTKKDDTQINVSLSFLDRAEVSEVDFVARTNLVGVDIEINGNPSPFSFFAIRDPSFTEYGPRIYGKLPAGNNNIINSTQWNGSSWNATVSGNTALPNFPIVNLAGNIVSIDPSGTADQILNDILTGGAEAARITENNLLYRKLSSNQLRIFRTNDTLLGYSLTASTPWGAVLSADNPTLFTPEEILTVIQTDTVKNVTVDLKELQINWGSVILNGTPGNTGTDAVDIDGAGSANYLEYTNFNDSTYYRIFDVDGEGETIRLTNQTTGTIVGTKTY